MSISQVDFTKLHDAIEWSSRQLDTPRKNRISAIKQFVGRHYSDNGSESNVPVNLMELAITVYIRQLAARAPRAIVSTDKTDLRPFASDIEVALNQVPAEIGLGTTLKKSVLDAMFTIGIVKVGLGTSGKKILDKEYAEPFVDKVSIDDYFVDMNAASRDLIQFEGNDYWLPLEDAKAMYGDGLDKDEYSVVSSTGAEKAASVSVNESHTIYKDMIHLRDVWLPREGRLLTYAIESKKQLRAVDWDGPEHGPYYILSYSEVPDNIMPLPPVALWFDLHDLANRLFRKLARQADSKKTVGAFQGGNDDDVQRLKQANDGEAITYNGAEPKTITVGGLDAPNLAFFLQTKELFSYVGGNIDSLGGLSRQSETLGQDKLIADASNSRINSMAEQTIDFVKEIFKALAWYIWTDPVRERTITKPVKGLDFSITKKWSPEIREGDFLDYNFDIDVYSMQDDSPGTKMQKITAIFQNYIMPMMPLLEAQGASVDVQALLKMVGKYSNLPELEELIKFAQQAPQQQGMGQDQGQRPDYVSTKAPVTTRNYVRSNRSGATQAGKTDVMSRLLMGGNVQASEGAQIGV